MAYNDSTLNELLNTAKRIKKEYNRFITLKNTRDSDFSGYDYPMSALKPFLNIEREILAHLSTEDAIKLTNKLNSKSFESFAHNPKNRFVMYRTTSALNRVSSQGYITSSDESSTLRINDAVQSDIYRAFVYFLNEYAHNANSNAERRKIIELIYSHSFMISSIEEEMLYNNFNIPNDLYFTSAISAFWENVSHEEYEEISNEYAKVCAMRHIEWFMKNFSTGISKNAPIAIMKDSYIRACFTLMDDDAINEVREWFIRLASSDRYANSTEKVILSCFDSIKTDREKPKVITIGTLE